jgi:acetyl esterase/lipase
VKPKPAQPRNSLVTARSPLAYLNAIVPKDSGTRRAAEGIAYGPNPRHRLDLYAPRRPASWVPVLFFIYGGGWNSGRRQEYSGIGRTFAKLGFLVAVADYRVFPEVRFPGFMDDAGLAANWLMAHAGEYGGDPSRFVLAGQSAGAYNAMMLALQPERFGAPDLKPRIGGVVGLAGPYDFFPFDVKESIDAFGEAADPELTQPINLVTAAAPPMFLAHGDLDRVVGPYHTMRLAKTLREAGVRVVEKNYPRSAHVDLLVDLLLPVRWRSPLYQDVAAFLRSLS